MTWWHECFAEPFIDPFGWVIGLRVITPAVVMRLVACSENYWEFVRVLRTDPRTSHGFIQQVEITPEQQRRYMAVHWQEYFIALVDGQPAGFVGSVDGDIRVCTHPDFQERGVGTFMISELLKLSLNGVAKVKIDNEASRALFVASGFVPTFIIYEPPADPQPLAKQCPGA